MKDKSDCAIGIYDANDITMLKYDNKNIKK